jgi:ethanolaminephosphotransferase
MSLQGSGTRVSALDGSCRGELTCAGSDRVQLLYRNAKQVKKIVEATYTGLNFEDRVLASEEMGFECSEPSHLADSQMLACLWQRVMNAIETDGDVSKHIQDVRN